MLEDVHTLCIGRHDSVLDPIVNHLHEVTRSSRTTVQVPVLTGATLAFATGCPFGLFDGWGNRRENRVDVLNGLVMTADHHAVAAVQSPDTTADPNVDIMNALVSQRFGSIDVVAVVGIAAVDQNVAL